MVRPKEAANLQLCYVVTRYILTNGTQIRKTKTATNLEIFYPNLIHATCLAHALSLVTEIIRHQYEDLNGLISSVKKTFLKAHFRIQVSGSLTGLSIASRTCSGKMEFVD